jgi:membrane protease YdiL (CAAX protease family)
MEANPPVVWLLLAGTSWSPAIAAATTRLLYRGRVPRAGVTRAPARFFALAAALALAGAGGGHLLAWLGGFGAPDLEPARALARGLGWAAAPDAAAFVVYLVVTVAKMLVPIGFFALGEELGWTGFLVPRLAGAYGFRRAALVFGAAWAAYHYPLILFSDYAREAPRWYALAGSTLAMGALGVSQSWLRLRSGSLWPCVLQHALLNVLIYHVFEPLTRRAPGADFFSGDSNAAGTLVGVVLAAVFWRRGVGRRAAAPRPPAELSLAEPSPAARAIAPREG